MTAPVVLDLAALMAPIPVAMAAAPELSEAFAGLFLNQVACEPEPEPAEDNERPRSDEAVVPLAVWVAPPPPPPITDSPELPVGCHGGADDRLSRAPAGEELRYVAEAGHTSGADDRLLSSALRGARAVEEHRQTTKSDGLPHPPAPQPELAFAARLALPAEAAPQELPDAPEPAAGEKSPPVSPEVEEPAKPPVRQAAPPPPRDAAPQPRPKQPLPDGRGSDNAVYIAAPQVKAGTREEPRPVAPTRGEPSETPPPPPREIAVRLPGRVVEGVRQEPVQVRLVERHGQVHVAVRTADPELAASLREGLPALATRLESGGIRAETWHPAIAQPAAASQLETEPRETRSGFDGGSPGFTGDGHPRERREQHNRPEWVQALEEERSR